MDIPFCQGRWTCQHINISIDDIPRLFTDADSRIKCIELWKEIARRYKSRWIVGGYDLLNEPLAPGHGEENALNPLTLALSELYEDLIAEIRKIDTKHMISVEGSRWATDTSLFYNSSSEWIRPVVSADL